MTRSRPQLSPHPADTAGSRIGHMQDGDSAMMGEHSPFSPGFAASSSRIASTNRLVSSVVTAPIIPPPHQPQTPPPQHQTNTSRPTIPVTLPEPFQFGMPTSLWPPSTNPTPSTIPHTPPPLPSITNTTPNTSIPITTSPWPIISSAVTTYSHPQPNPTPYSQWPVSSPAYGHYNPYNNYNSYY